MLEILAPVGSAECAEAAINNGADAIYLGLSSFSARSNAENFDETALRNTLAKAHFCGVKVYVAMNTIVKNSEIDSFLRSLLSAWNMGVDAIIMQDIFFGKFIHERYPDIVLHLSTQAGVCTVEGAKLAVEYGFSRVILARETPLKEIEKITKIIETEAFVQGALCTAFSGQCFFSSFVGGNSGNRGRCKQPCRKLYAYDRNGNEEKSYALSLSDLCVGEDIQKLIRAGVLSFKIEGRMRRAEYVGAAVSYYRKLLDEKNNAQAFSDLKRAYNRGNYTKGLAFGQDKCLLSTSIQGHIGEKVGVVKVVNGKYLVESAFKPNTGDAFKILRDGKELGGATYAKIEGRVFLLNSKIRLKNGDGVFITTDTAANTRALSARRAGTLSVRVYCAEGEFPKAICGDIVVTGKSPLQSAQNRPLSVAEIENCFLKTDGLPVSVHFEEISVEGNCFLPKSELNGFRREFYVAIAEKVTQRGNTKYEYLPIKLPTFNGRNEKKAIISNNFEGIKTDIAIYKADDYQAPLPDSFLQGNFEKYLYYPAFVTSEDIACLCQRLSEGNIDGIYAENYSGLYFAKEQNMKLFAGTGFHIFNSISLAEILKETPAYYAISKECNAEEGETLISDKSFAFSFGNIKLMDLCYCPFGKTCGVCDKKSIYTLTDEGGRKFPVRRYRSADGSCRFEVYNCVNLIGLGIKGGGKLADFSVTSDKIAAVKAIDDEGQQKQLYAQYTSGHYKRGVL